MKIFSQGTVLFSTGLLSGIRTRLASWAWGYLLLIFCFLLSVIIFFCEFIYLLFIYYAVWIQSYDVLQVNEQLSGYTQELRALRHLDRENNKLNNLVARLTCFSLQEFTDAASKEGLVVEQLQHISDQYSMKLMCAGKAKFSALYLFLKNFLTQTSCSLDSFRFKKNQLDWLDFSFVITADRDNHA